MKEIAGALSAPLLGDPELQQQLVKALQPRNEDAHLERCSELEWAVLQALYSEAHLRRGYHFIGNLTQAVERFLALSGETQGLKPRKIGEIVRASFGCRTTRSGNGYYVVFGPQERRRIHELVSNYGMKRSDILDTVPVQAGCAGPPCRLCDEFGLNTDHRGNLLRCVKSDAPPRTRRGLFEPVPDDE